VLDQPVAARQGIADHAQVRPRAQLRRVVAVGHGDAGGGQLIAHRRVDGGVAAAHGMPPGLGQLRQAGHEGTGDTEDVQMHQSINPNRWPRVE
jgi:hypothetical protein